jgi:endogenous inhibitor of DNA gyrase (YacG/DUF329 family)
MVMSERCPICRKSSVPSTRPFCSQRCADIDLGRWLTAQYVVPGADGEADPAGLEEAAGDA